MSAEQEEQEFLQDLLLETSSEIYVNNKAVVSLSSAEAEFYAAVKAAAAGISCVAMMRDLGVILQQQGVEVKAKGLGDGVLASKSSWMQRQAEPLQCDEVPDVSDMS